jgi:sialate O-acetylesterase
MSVRASSRAALPWAALLLALVAGSHIHSAEVAPMAPFNDGMVLQRDMAVPVWGAARPGEQVTVGFAGQRKTATAGADGRWRVDLDPLPASAEGRELIIAGGGVTRTVRDVLVGEVWIASGQSNMEYGVGHVVNAKAEIAAADHPLIRVFTVKTAVAAEPQRAVSGSWAVCTPANAGGFTATGYFFARDLQARLGIPVGLIHSAVSGTLAEAWTSGEALAKDPMLVPILARYDEAVAAYPAAKAAYEAALKVWQAEAAAATAAGKPEPKKPAEPADPAVQTTRPAGLFNGKIAPLIPVAFRGVIWWQGEYNSERCEQYATFFPTLIRDWRARWNRGDFPFLFVQLQNLDIQPQPNSAHYDELREAQFKTLRSVPATGMVVACDVGDAHDIHPPNKQAVGARLALAARALAYGEQIAWSGPLYAGMAVEGARIQVRFDHLGGGLVDRDGKGLGGFTIAGADRQFVAATAAIDGDAVVVSSPAVPQPVAVRYAWADNPTCTLYNQAGLPASPFRTDGWPLPSDGKR